MSLGNLAVKYLLQFDMVSTVLPAMNSVEEVLENCRASGDGPLPRTRSASWIIYREESERAFQELLGDNDYWSTPWEG